MTSILSRTAGVAFAALLTLPVAAFAADTQPAAAAAGMGAVAAIQAPNPATRYCVVTRASTGTILDRKVCKTRDQWLATGVDPLAAK